MADELQQESRDQFAILMQALSNLMGVFSALNQKVDSSMATLADVTAEIMAIKISHAALKTAIEKTLGELADIGAAGHAAVLDKVVADLKEVHGTMDADTTEITAKIMSTPVPGVAPAA